MHHAFKFIKHDDFLHDMEQVKPHYYYLLPPHDYIFLMDPTIIILD